MNNTPELTQNVTLSLQEMHDLADSMVIDIAIIESKLAGVAERSANGIAPANPVWVNSATSALRFKKVEHEALLREIRLATMDEDDEPVEHEAHNSLNHRRLAVLRELAVIKAQIGKAAVRSTKHSGKKEARWLRSAQAALTFKQAEYQQVLAELSSKNDRRRLSAFSADRGSVITKALNTKSLDTQLAAATKAANLAEQATATLREIATLKLVIANSKPLVGSRTKLPNQARLAEAFETLKAKQALHQQLLQSIGEQNRIGKALRVERDEKASSMFYRIFHHVASEILDNALHARICVEVNRRGYAGKKAISTFRMVACDMLDSALYASIVDEVNRRALAEIEMSDAETD